MTDLDLLRIEIDDIDQELTQLIERRFSVAKKIAEYKKTHGLAILDEEREEKVIQKNIDRLDNPEFSNHLETFYQGVMSISKDIQENV